MGPCLWLLSPGRKAGHVARMGLTTRLRALSVKIIIEINEGFYFGNTSCLELKLKPSLPSSLELHCQAITYVFAGL